MAIPAKLQNDIKVYQRLQQELGAIGQQRAQFELKLRETSRTLEEIQGLPEETPMYRTVGGLLVKAKSKKDVVDLLSDEKETLEVRIKAVERQENHLRERYESMQKELTEAIQAAGLAESASSKGKE
ncbi:MAG: prefoldin subunit beta [Candidatus Thermoplasmatota archaeon]|jgi:prefoldin beta subunit|nr:prefoldin subunit beta [Candidatus Thermoplasmatota archaeon]